MSFAFASMARLDDTRRFMSREACRELAQRILSVSTSGETDVTIDSWWSGELHWARNGIALATDRRTTTAVIRRVLAGAEGAVSTDQFDEQSIVAAVRAADRLAHWRRTEMADLVTPRPTFSYPATTVWDDATFGQTQLERARTAERAIRAVERTGMMSAGYLEVRARGWARITSDGLSLYSPTTSAQCTMTVRDPLGTGSGWAGASSYAWSAFDIENMITQSVHKCLTSRSPVAVEPGRYTVILEPQAVSDLLAMMLDPHKLALDRKRAEGGRGAFAGKVGVSLLGKRVVDPRVTLSYDPHDPLLGTQPFTEDGDPYRKVSWITDGVLTALAYDRAYSLRQLNENEALQNSGAFRMSGGTTSTDEMIRTTKRGLLITRFSNITAESNRDLYVTGYTRDGVWLIEKGAIAKAVKNFRFEESPLFVLNNIEQLGVPVPTFRPGMPAIVPPLKIRDFNCVALADAV